jgi:hypothetical protein
METKICKHCKHEVTQSDAASPIIEVSGFAPTVCSGAASAPFLHEIARK